MRRKRRWIHIVSTLTTISNCIFNYIYMVTESLFALTVKLELSTLFSDTMFRQEKKQKNIYIYDNYYFNDYLVKRKKKEIKVKI